MTSSINISNPTTVSSTQTKMSPPGGPQQTAFNTAANKAKKTTADMANQADTAIDDTYESLENNATDLLSQPGLNGPGATEEGPDGRLSRNNDQEQKALDRVKPNRDKIRSRQQTNNASNPPKGKTTFLL